LGTGLVIVLTNEFPYGGGVVSNQFVLTVPPANTGYKITVLSKGLQLSVFRYSWCFMQKLN
jgi:hypothetical protein